MPIPWSRVSNIRWTRSRGRARFPQDGILDARREQFTLRLDVALAGRTLVVRRTDAMNNVGTGEIVLK